MQYQIIKVTTFLAVWPKRLEAIFGISGDMICRSNCVPALQEGPGDRKRLIILKERSEMIDKD